MGLKPTAELLIKAFILSRSRPENSPALSGHFVGLLVLYFIGHVSSHGSVLPCFRGALKSMGTGVLMQPRERHRTVVLQGEHSLMRKLVFYV